MVAIKIVTKAIVPVSCWSVGAGTIPVPFVYDPAVNEIKIKINFIKWSSGVLDN